MFAASRNAVNDSQPASVFMALTESALLSRSASRSSEVAIPRRLYRLSTAIRAMSPEAGSKMQYPTCVPSARALSPAKSPAARLMASGLFCQEGMKSQNCGSGANVRALLYGIIEFTRRFEPELPVDRYRLCVVLQDFQQVLPDSGLPQVGDGVFEDLCSEPLPAIGFEGSRAGVVGRRQAVEIPSPIQGERGDPLPVERGERQAGIETAPAQHAPELCFVQLDFVIGECLAECLEQRAETCIFQ